MPDFNESTLLCTLGGQPQIVTFALDYLLARGEQVREVFVVHLTSTDGRVEQALTRLRAEFEDDRYQNRPCRFRAVPLRRGTDLLAAIRTEAEADAVRQTVFALVADLKQAGRTLHLCLAGGPRMMSLMALSAAMLFCGHQDKVWHIYTEPAFLEQARNGAVMHDPGGEQVRLVQVPVVPWASYLPPLFNPGRSPDEFMIAQTTWLEQAEQQRCRAVWQQLTPRERDVVISFAEGLGPQEVAERLAITIKTVSTHTTNIFAKCRLGWELPEDAPLTFHFLRDKFRGFPGNV
jgi:CRISPR-associated protein Csx14